MCGIAGGLFWGDAVDPRRAEGAVAAMVASLAHRGPDGRGLYSSASGAEPRTAADAARPAGPLAVLGHTRLAILDLSPSGAQPMGGCGGEPYLVYNGEIYNFRELGAELARDGARFHSRSDTEVLLRGYETWGRDVVGRLRGMFAFGLWDPRRARLLLARDRFGIKPLYYYAGDAFLLFASEVRALLASGLVPPRLDPIALWQYLGYQAVPAPRTLVRGVRMLEPGAWMTVDAAGRRDGHAYWHLLEAAAHAPEGPEGGAPQRVRERLRDAVAAHLVSDVPVAAFLSGGIDSSAVVALVREAGCTPRTFSVGFAERAFDESAHAALVARRFGAEHTHVPLRERDLLDQLPDAIGAMDQPTGDGINTFVVARTVRARGLKVALSGLGGDELFGGYPSFARLARLAVLSPLWRRSPARARALAAGTVRALGRASVPAVKAAAILESDGSLAAAFPLTRQLLSPAQRRRLLADGLVPEDAARADPYETLLSADFERFGTAGVYGRVSFAEARTYMHDVLLRDTDQMSMAHGLEVRVPLLDHPLAEYIVGLPDAVKRSNRTPKRLLAEALQGVLPPEIVGRPKQGFTLPFEPWMRGALRSFCEERLGERGLVGRGICREAAIGALWRSFLDGGKDVSWSRIWTLVVLDAWLDRHPLQHVD